jgi:hypothetical protein
MCGAAIFQAAFFGFREEFFIFLKKINKTLKERNEF